MQLVEPTARWTKRTRQYALATIVLLGSSILAATRSLGFREAPPPLSGNENPSLWQLVLSDRITLGFVKLGILMLALYAILSIPALILAGRWLRAFAPGTLAADDPLDTSQTVEALRARLRTTEAELREAILLAKGSSHG